MSTVDGVADRYLFWEKRTGDDLRGSRAVAYRIEGHGTGAFLWCPGQTTTGLFRYDLGRTSFPAGSLLLSINQRIGWFPSERPDRCVALGSEDPGNPVSRTAAQAIARDLGYSWAVLDEPTGDGGPISSALP